VLITCWSVKGGSGTTVVAAALALVAARTGAGALLVDASGDQPAALGLPEPSAPGVGDWLAAHTSVPPDHLRLLEADVRPGLHLLARGSPWLSGDANRAHALAARLAADDRTVVVDSGLGSLAELAVVGAAHRSLLVLRPCYLALRRAVASPLRPSGVVLVHEPRRALRRTDVEAVLGVPVVAQVDVDPEVARVVDAGLLGARLPRTLEHGLRNAV
jgi:hypothetical protein